MDASEHGARVDHGADSIDTTSVEEIAGRLAQILREVSEQTAAGVVERLRLIDGVVLPAPAPVERLLNRREVEEILGRSTRWVRDRVRCSELPVVRLDGGALAFRPADIEAFINRHRVPPIDQPAPSREPPRSRRYLTTGGAQSRARG